MILKWNFPSPGTGKEKRMEGELKRAEEAENTAGRKTAGRKTKESLIFDMTREELICFIDHIKDGTVVSIRIEETAEGRG